MTVLARVESHRFSRPAEEHVGWIPDHAVIPAKTPPLSAEVALSIVSEAKGVLLVVKSLESSLSSDTWYATVREAKLAALESYAVPLESWANEFGVRPGCWRQNRMLSVLEDLCSTFGLCDALSHFEQLNSEAWLDDRALVSRVFQLERLNINDHPALYSQAIEVAARHSKREDGGA